MDEKADEESTGSSQARGDAVSLQTLQGDCRDTLKQIPDGTVQCCVTSIPYYGLRRYLRKGHPDAHKEIGQEKTVELYIETIVNVFREVRRTLHISGTVWLNSGDSYWGGKGQSGSGNPEEQAARAEAGVSINRAHHQIAGDGLTRPTDGKHPYYKPKDLCLIPFRIADALQRDGWWLRSVICWHKKSCMPESVTDRPTNSWEPIFLLAKSQTYFFDNEAVKEPVSSASLADGRTERGQRGTKGEYAAVSGACGFDPSGRNQRNVWTLGPEPYSEAHFATFPTEIPRRAILAGTSARGCCPKCFAPWERVVEKQFVSTRGNSVKAGHTGKHLDESNNWKNEGCGVNETRTVGWQQGCDCGDAEIFDGTKPVPCTVLDPFGGSGTTGAVAIELGRRAILCELNDAYLPLIQKRTNVTKGLALA